MVKGITKPLPQLPTPDIHAEKWELHLHVFQNFLQLAVICFGQPLVLTPILFSITGLILIFSAKQQRKLLQQPWRREKNT